MVVRGLMEGDGGTGTKSCSGGTMEENSSCCTGISCLCPPLLHSLSCLPALFSTPFSRMETARAIFQLEMGEAVNLMRRTAAITGREIQC